VDAMRPAPRSTHRRRRRSPLGWAIYLTAWATIGVIMLAALSMAFWVLDVLADSMPSWSAIALALGLFVFAGAMITRETR
jgi:uncharacterized membrane protein YgdD (TMEM256/DUF423 family)